MKRAALIAFSSLTARKALEGAFVAEGFRTLTCATAHEVRQALGRERDIAVAVVDPNLPEGGAGDVLGSISPGGPQRPLVLVDGEPSDLRATPGGLRHQEVRFLGREWDAPGVAQTARAVLGTPEEEELRGFRLLAVDDSATFRAQLEDQLGSAGYTVITASSGEEALSLLRTSAVDAVLLDMVMPGIDGVETCRRIRADERFRVIPVLMLTAVEGKDALLAALHAGADDFVAKGGEVEILLARLRAHLRRKRYEDENRRMREELYRSELDVARERGAKQLAETQARLLGDLERKNRELAQAVRARDEFVSIASHELKTPLTSMLMHVQTLRGAFPDTANPRMQHKLEVIERQVHRLNALVAELLDIARITGRRLELNAEEVDLGRLTREVVSGFREQLDCAGCELNLRVKGAVQGVWDRGRLEQVLWNLLSNAVKYGPGAPIDIEVRQEDGLAVLEVHDRGIGIPPEAQARIFERFERAVSVRQYGGFGLGLWIARQIIEAHNGSISVESEPGEGSLFRVSLPVRPALEQGASDHA